MELVEQVIRSSMVSQYVFSKTKFDNVKDTNDLIAAATENSEMLVKAIEYRLHDRVEQMLCELIDKTIEDGRMMVRIGTKWYELNELQSPTTHAAQKGNTE